MKFDETELIEFFGVLPSQQNPDEKEFFGTTIFDYTQANIRVSLSFSIYYNDLYLTLNAAGLEKPLLEIYSENVTEIKVRRDKPTSIPMLLIKARSDNEDVIQTIEIHLQPNISVKLSN